MFSRLSFLLVAAVIVLSAVMILKWSNDDLVLYEPPPAKPADARPSTPLRISEPADNLTETQARVFRLNVSEELILRLVPKLKEIGQYLEGNSKRLPDLFSSDCQINGIVKDHIDLKDVLAIAPAPDLFKKLEWPIGQYRPLTDSLGIWPTIFAHGTFKNCKFGVVSGHLLPGGNTFQMETSFEGNLVLHGKPQSARALGGKAIQILNFERTPEDQWKIAKWEQVSFQIQVASTHLFSDVTASVVSQTSAETIKRSEIADLLRHELRGEEIQLKSEKMFELFNDWHSSAQFNSVSVVDFDNDQWDDLFLTNNLGQTLLLRNSQDGTFEDASSESGLSLERAYTNCALFADFDNDGDKDVILGRNFEQCLYFENEDGKLVPHNENNRALQDCKLVSAGSVIDINNDGLLDVYLSTYSQNLGASEEWIDYAVPERQAETLRQKSKFRHSYLDRAGPPNIVLMNFNGKLKRLEPEGPLAQWRNSFQSVWLDYDSDGDQDVYICNDFAPDVLLENQTERHSEKPSFKDVSEKVFGTRLMGFGMGGSVGDYDNDGLLDIYVSNMYSKAGNRIFEQLERNAHPALQIAASGNFLYRNTGEKRFSQKAGPSEEDQHVAKVGWSYGGQFADFNNDGHLDVYVPSGLFTPPKEVDADLDL